MTSDQKYEISCAINEAIYTDLEKGKKEAEGKIDSLKAIVEETEIRIGELKREAYEFKRDVVVGAENPRTGQIMAEKVVKYFEDELKSKDVIIEKLKLKNNNLKSQAYKMPPTICRLQFEVHNLESAIWNVEIGIWRLEDGTKQSNYNNQNNKQEAGRQGKEVGRLNPRIRLAQALS